MTLTAEKPHTVEPFSLKDAPSLIEKAWPTAKISAETYKERNAKQAQTLTALGSFWKGRKPLILTRACLLGSLIPATENPEKDIEIFEKLMGMADETFGRRFIGGPTAFAKLFPEHAESVANCKDYAWTVSSDGDTQRAAAERLLQTRADDDLPGYLTRDLRAIAAGHYPEGDPKFFADTLQGDALPFVEAKHRSWRWREDLPEAERERLITKAFMTLNYAKRLEQVKRPEEIPDGELLEGIWGEVNEHLETSAFSIPELVEQLGIMRFGRRPKVADTFSGSGQIPFEAARMGSDAYASDLNPVACMLTWGTFNIVGADQAVQDAMTADQQRLVEEIDTEIRKLGIEHDEEGNRAKVYLYCLETRCPRTGYMVPVAPSFVISRRRSVVAKLIPNHDAKRYDFEIVMGASTDEMREAALGTSRGGRLFHPLLDDDFGVSIKEIRGDYKDNNGLNRNRLRFWEKSDFKPRPDDIWQERLYAIQWMDAKDLVKGKANPRSWFAAPTEADLDRERLVEEIVGKNFSAWQEAGLVPDMEIEAGYNTSQPIRERGWTYWHHLYTPRSLLLGSMVTSRYKEDPRHFLSIAIFANRMAKTVDWHAGDEFANHTFTNQAINTLQNYPVRGFHNARKLLTPKYFCTGLVNGCVTNKPSKEVVEVFDIFITDPPYADAVNYDEITEFFIAWLRRNPPHPFDEWLWDSRRNLAIKGDGQPFKASMVETYTAMTGHLVDNGVQIVQFTHQDAKTWSDMAQIFWGAGLQVVQDWYVSTELNSATRKGGYVQGTHMIVLRKRQGEQSGYQDEIVHEIRDEVERQIKEMTGLNDRMDAARGENIFNDADLQMAGYAAALRVLTAYTKIDGVDMTREALRPRKKDEKTIVDELTEFAVQTANEFLVPEGLARDLWLDLNGAERFYLKMVDIEEVGPAKLDQFQNFAKAFRVSDYDDMMASKSPNNARLKAAKQLGKTQMAEGTQFGKDSLVRLALRGIWRVEKEDEVDDALEEMRDLIPDYMRQRDTLMAITRYIADKREDRAPEEAAAARILASAIQMERI